MRKNVILTIVLWSLPFLCSANIYFYDDKNLQHYSAMKKIGGKAFNLLFLDKVPEISVPKWFVVSINVFDGYLKENKIDGLIEQLNDACASNIVDNNMIVELANKIQHQILNGIINADLQEKIQYAYVKLKQQIGNETKLAIRSSGIAEDSSVASFAGLYDSYLNQNSIADVNMAIKKVWASSFNLRAIQERILLKQSQIQCGIAVIVQEMIKPVAAGVITTIELSTNYPGIEIIANSGLGENVVNGEIRCDKWLVHESKNYIIKQISANKEDRIFSIDNSSILRLAGNARRIKIDYRKDVDIEFVMDNKGKFFFVQVRPLVAVNTNNLFVVDREKAKNASVLAKGLYSLPGVKHGILKFIKKWEVLTKEAIPHETIIMAYRPANTWSHYISNIAGLITKEGSPTSHVMLLARERGIACLSGIEDEFDKLRQYDGKAVTIDGINRLIYEGKIPLKEATQADFIKYYATVKVDPLPSLDNQLDYFKNSDMILFADGKYWFKTPQYPLKKFEQEINLNRFKILPDIVGNKQELEDKTRVINDHVYCLVLGFKNMVDSFGFASVAEAEQYLEREELNIQEYLKVTKDYVLNKKNWRQYTQTYTKLRAYNWVGSAYRAYLTTLIQQEAKDLDLPQCYLDEMYSSFQAGLYEEDTQMQIDVHNFARKIMYLEVGGLKQLEVFHPKLFAELIQIGKAYRLIYEVGIDRPLDLQAVYDKIILEVKNIKMGGGLISQKGKSAEQYLPDHPQLIKMIELSLRSRVNQSNSHHYLIRGQWQVREQLFNLGEKLVMQGKLNSSQDIFDCSIEEIENYI